MGGSGGCFCWEARAGAPARCLFGNRATAAPAAASVVPLPSARLPAVLLQTTGPWARRRPDFARTGLVFCSAPFAYHQPGIDRSFSGPGRICFDPPDFAVGPSGFAGPADFVIVDSYPGPWNPSGPVFFDFVAAAVVSSVPPVVSSSQNPG